MEQQSVKALIYIYFFIICLNPFFITFFPLQDDYSQYGIQAFTTQFQKQGGCVAFHLTIPKSSTLTEIQEMADRLQSSVARVVVVFATEGQLLDLFFEVCVSADLTALNIGGS